MVFTSLLSPFHSLNKNTDNGYRINDYIAAAVSLNFLFLFSVCGHQINLFFLLIPPVVFIVCVYSKNHFGKQRESLVNWWKWNFWHLGQNRRINNNNKKEECKFVERLFTTHCLNVAAVILSAVIFRIEAFFLPFSHHPPSSPFSIVCLFIYISHFFLFFLEIHWIQRIHNRFANFDWKHSYNSFCCISFHFSHIIMSSLHLQYYMLCRLFGFETVVKWVVY